MLRLGTTNLTPETFMDPFVWAPLPVAATEARNETLNSSVQSCACGQFPIRSSRALALSVMLALVAVGALSCNSKSSVTPTAPTPVVISVSLSGSSAFTAPGQSSQLSAIANYSNNTTENVTTNAVWQTSNPIVAVVSGSGLLMARGVGAAQVTAVYQGQTGTADVTVSGPPPPPCTISLSESAVTFDRTGGPRSVNVQTSTASCSWQATSNASWLRITSSAVGTGNSVVSYQVDAHTGTGVREGAISVIGQTLTVRQTSDPPSCRYCVSPPARTVTSAGGTFTISVDPATNSDGTAIDWTVVSDQPWVRITSGPAGRGRGTVIYVVDRNGFPSQRTATISVGGLSGQFARETHALTQLP